MPLSVDNFSGVSPDAPPDADSLLAPGVSGSNPGDPIAPMSPTSQMTFGNAIKYGLPGAVAGLADTIGQSLGVFHDNTVPDFIKSVTGSGPGSMGDFYQREQPALRATGEIAGMALPGLAAMKVLKTVKMAREAGTFGETLMNSSAMDVLLGNSANLTAQENAISNAAISARLEQGVTAGRTIATPAVNAARKSYYASRAVEAVRTTAAFELGNRLAFGSSSTFYPADYTLTDQLKWSGLGLAAGVGLDFVAARYVARNLVQSSIKAYGNMAAEYGEVVPSTASSTMAMNSDKVLFRPNMRGVGITQQASTSQELDHIASINNNQNFKANVAQDQVNIKNTITTQIKAGAYDTHAFLPRTSLNDDQVELGYQATKVDPTAFLFMKKLAQVPIDGMEAFYTGIKESLEKARNDFGVSMFAASGVADPVEQHKLVLAANAKLNPIEDAANEIHYVIENDGRTTVYKNRADNFLDQNTFGDIKRSTYQTPNPAAPAVPLKNSKLTVDADNTIILHDNFRAEIPKNATPMDYSALYAAGSKLIKTWKAVPGQTFILTPELPWRTIEGTLALADANPEAMAAVRLGGDFGSLDDARFHVLNEKMKELNTLMPNTAAPAVPPAGAAAQRLAAVKPTYTPAQVIQRLNLPEGSGLAPSPVVELAAHMRLQGQDDLYQMFPLKSNTLTPPSYSRWDMLQQHLRETAGIADNSTEMPTQGPLLNQGNVAKSPAGELSVTAPKPLFVAANSTPMMGRADAMVIARVQAMRDAQLERLSQIGPKDSPLVSGVLAKLISQGGNAGELSGAANQSRAVQTLQDAVLAGSGQVVYQDRVNEQFATLKATQLLAQDTDNFTRNYVAKLSSASLTPKLADILQFKNRADLLDFNRIEQAYRHGWDITGFERHPSGKGMVAKLNPDSAMNSKLMDAHFAGSTVPQGMEGYMPDMSVTARKAAPGSDIPSFSPLTVSSKAADLAQAISDMSRQSGHENNQLLAALGRNPIRLRDFHLPTPELSNENAWFVRNEQGNVIQTYGRSTFDANKKQAEEAVATLNANPSISGMKHTAVPLTAVRRDHLLNDETFMNIIDYQDQLAKTGVAIKGTGAQLQIDSTDQTLKAMVNSLQRQYLNIGIRARAAVFEPEIQYAKQASVGVGTDPRSNFGGINIFDHYISTMFSNSPVSGKGVLSKIYNDAENAMDRFLSIAHTNITNLIGDEPQKKAAAVMNTLMRKQTDPSEFAQWQKVLPEYNPLKDTADWAESTFREKPEWASKPIMNQLTKVATALQLRFLDVGMSVIHFGNLATNMPAVMASMRQLPGESLDTWRSRTAAYSSEIADGVKTFSMDKMMKVVSKRLWDGSLTGPMNDAASMGYFEPEAASLTRLLTTPAKTKVGQYWNTFTSAATYLADHSEIMARQLSWGVGYTLAKDLHQMQDEKDAYIYANNFVNEMIGNYQPNNKPAMFSGVVGQALGSYQTYMTNLYRRLFSYVETQNKAALFAQYAAQATVFGGKSIPGYAAWNALFQRNDMGGDDFTDRVNKRFAPGVGELLMNGSISNIPKIFTGLAGDAFSWNTRGTADMTELPVNPLVSFLRTGSPADLTRAPPIQFLAETAQGIVATVNNVISNEGFSLEQQEHVMAAFSTNRAMKAIMEMAADAKVDQRGNVIQYGTRNWMHIAASMAGTTTASVQQMQEASAKEKSVQRNQEDARAELNMQTRAIFQSGKFDISTLQAMVRDYTKSGGNPAYLGEWLRNNLIASSTPKSVATMQSLAKSGKLGEFEDMLAALQQNQNPSSSQK